MVNNIIEYTCHSGGCPGADIAWETECAKYNVPTIAYSFHNHVQEGKQQKILTLEELAEGWQHVEEANKTLNRNLTQLYPYVRNLLSRNWFQVKNSEAVFAIGKFGDKNYRVIDGGTGWACQMAIDSGRPLYFFDQKGPTPGWYTFLSTAPIFYPIGPTGTIPKLTPQFAGIGSRNLNSNGRNAITKIIEYNFT